MTDPPTPSAPPPPAGAPSPLVASTPPSAPTSALLRAASWTTLIASAATLGWSYTLPTVEFTAAFSEPEVYSIWGGIEMLWLDGSPVLAAIVFVFSMVYPVGKLLALAAAALSGKREGRRRRAVHLLELFGKWSMLDVFVVGAFVGSIRLQLGAGIQLAQGVSRPGIEVFLGAIVLSMIATVMVARLLDRGGRELHPLRDGGHALGRLLTTASAAALGVALAQPLVAVTKGLIFRNEVTLAGTTWRMAGSEELLLAGTLGVFVIGTSAARSLVALRIRWLGGTGPATLRLALGLEEWAMLDVFALGMVIVWIKLDQLATATLLPGFWWMLAAAALGTADAWVLRRDARAAVAQARSASSSTVNATS